MRLREERSNLFILSLKGDDTVATEINRGDEGIVRAEPWVEHGDVRGAA